MLCALMLIPETEHLKFQATKYVHREYGPGVEEVLSLEAR